MGGKPGSHAPSNDCTCPPTDDKDLMTWRDVMDMDLEFGVWNEGPVKYDLLKVL